MLIFSSCQSQKLNTIYYGASSDSLYYGHQIEFKSDTTLQLSTFPRHMSRQFKLTFKYKVVNKTLEIYNTKISQQDSTALTNNGFRQFFKKLVLTIDGKALTDNSNNLVCVHYNDFKKKYYLTYLIDDKLYKQGNRSFGCLGNH